MTLNINLEEVPFAILEVVKARILANRRKLQQGQQQPRPSLRPKPQFVKQGASSKGWRLPKQAVLVEESSKKIGVAFTKTTNDLVPDGFIPAWMVRSGDYSKSLKVSTGYLESGGGFAITDRFILPVDGSVGIVVIALWGLPDPEVNVFRRLDFVRAFLVGYSFIKQIQVPGYLQSFLSDYFIEPRSPQTDFLFNEVSAVGWADAPLFGVFGGYWSPAVYQTLGVGSKQFSSGKNYIAVDYRRGFYANQDPSFYFAEWIGNPSSYDFNNGARLLPLSDSTVYAPTFPNLDFPDWVFVPDYAFEQFFWDWDDPAYCRQMCLALGFSAADLQP